MKSFKEFLQEAQPSWVIPNGTKVKWNYRSTTAVGTVQSVATLGKTADETRYDIRPAEKKFHHGEPDIVIHTGANLTRVSEDEFKRHIEKVAKAHENESNP